MRLDASETKALAKASRASGTVQPEIHEICWFFPGDAGAGDMGSWSHISHVHASQGSCEFSDTTWMAGTTVTGAIVAAAHLAVLKERIPQSAIAEHRLSASASKSRDRNFKQDV